MTSSDAESELSKALTNPTNLFSIAARSAVLSIPANRTRYARTRRGLISSKRLKKRFITQVAISQTSNDHIAFAIVSINVSETFDRDEKEGEEEEEEEGGEFSQDSRTPGPESSVS